MILNDLRLVNLHEAARISIIMEVDPVDYKRIVQEYVEIDIKSVLEIKDVITLDALRELREDPAFQKLYLSEKRNKLKQTMQETKDRFKKSKKFALEHLFFEFKCKSSNLKEHLFLYERQIHRIKKNLKVSVMKIELKRY